MIKKFVGMGLWSIRQKRGRITAGATFVGMGLAPIRPIDK